MDKIINTSLPICIFFACIGNALLKSIGLNYIYFGLIIISITLMSLRGFSFKKRDVAIFIFYPIYLISFVATSWIDSEVMPAISSMLLYTIFPAYWFLLYRCKSNFCIDLFLSSTINYILLLSILGILQFYVSPTLFGIMNTINSFNFEWADGQDFSIYSTFFRATSILTSPQVFGLLTALYVILADCYTNKYRSIIIFTISVASIHSGNKISLLIILLFIVFKIIHKSGILYLLKYASLLIIIASTIFILIYDKIDSEIGFVYRNLSIENITNEEKEGRIKIYQSHISSTNFILGEKPGYFSKVSINERHPSESYLLQILIENGLFWFVSFLVFYAYSTLRTPLNAPSHFYLISISLFVSLVVAHSFTDPSFFSIWSIIIYLFTRDGKSTNTTSLAKN